MKMIRRLNTALEQGLAKMVFDHVRNFLMCAFLLAIGTSELKHNSNLLFGFAPSHYAGTGVIGLSFILIGLNLYDGIRKISSSRYHLIFTFGLIAIYIFLSVRIVEITWNFRAAA